MPELQTTSLRSDANLVGYWRFEGNSTATVGTNGTDANMSYAVAKYGQGAVFNGSNAKVTIADNNAWSIPTTGKLSIGFWANAGSLKSNNTPIMKGTDSGVQYEWRIQYGTAGGAVSFEAWNLAGNQRYVTTSAASVVGTSSYNFVVVTVDNSVAWANTNAKLYINGMDGASTYGGSSTYTLSNSTSALVVGQRSDSIATYFDGTVDDLFIFNDVLTPAEISSLYVGKNLALLGVG